MTGNIPPWREPEGSETVVLVSKHHPPRTHIKDRPMTASASRPPSGTLRSLSTALLPWAAAVLVVVGAEHSRQGQPGEQLAAAGQWSRDLDGDGLPDGQERILGTDSANADTDGDGFSDGYEWAARSSPIDEGSLPQLNEISMNITARGGAGESAKVLYGLLSENGELSDKMIMTGMMLGSMRLNIPFSFIRDNSQHCILPQSDGSTLYLFQIKVQGPQIQAYGELTYFGSASQVNGQAPSSAAVADIIVMDGIACLRIDLDSAGFYNNSSLSVFRPIPGGSQTPPDTWTQGTLCVKEVEPQSQTGAMVTMFVSSAGCSEPWNGGLCPPDCGQAAGTTFTTVDPLLLVGG